MARTTMKKDAITDHEVLDLIRERWSPRAFSDRSISDQTLRSLFEAARWAPSCFNEQPWRFLVAKKENDPEFRRMIDVLSPNNQRWAKDAAVLLISVASSNFARSGKPNRHAFHDVGQAVAQLTLQAVSMGIFVHQMAGFDVIAARHTYDIPEDFEPVAAIAIGYLGSPDQLPDD